MTLEQILATPRKIAYVDNTGEARMFDEQIRAAVYADSTELPSAIADIFKLTYVQIGDERRAIINWA